MRKFAIILAIIVVLAVALGFASPYIVSRGLETGLQRMLGTNATVDLAAYPSLRLLLGQFDSLSIVAENVQLGGIVAREYRVATENTSVNMRKLLLNQEIEFVEQGDILVSITLTESEITRYLWEQIPELKDWQLLINPDEVIVSGQAPLLNAMFDIRLTGTLEASSGNKVAFALDKVEVQGAALPTAIAQLAFKDTEFYIDLSEAPMPLELTRIEMLAGQLILHARVLEE